MMNMLEATQAVCRRLSDDVPVVASLGNPGLNLFNAQPGRQRNFYFRNAMGSASSLALGLATAAPEQRVVLLDGDGSLLMNLSSLASEGWRGPRNLVHICWDNRMYEMTGQQATATSGPADLAAIAEGAGFPKVERAETLAAFEAALERALAGDGPWFILAVVAGERAKRNPANPKSATGIRHRFMGELGA
ncbi:MAG TPA: thiamine pyrophosphate-dependent enzyme [bacterium]|nr:thiamine pyrophosphate-dependent enzyme [bacterium]